MLTISDRVYRELIISDSSLNLTVTEEDGSQLYYTRHYQNFEWPTGASGPTVGIGYDCGYCTPDEIRVDWTGIIPDRMVATLVAASGLRGGVAEAWVSQNKTAVTIPWDLAIRQFKEREVPKWLRRMEAVLDNLELLSSDCLGVLFSLSYNRGVGGYDNPGARFAEMRQIKACCASRDFGRIPELLRSMRRLWPVNGDLWKRRSHEAVLFEVGLKEKPPAPPLPVPAPTPVPPAPSPTPVPVPRPPAPHGTGTVLAMLSAGGAGAAHYLGAHWTIPAALLGAVALCILFEVYLRRRS